MFFIAALLALMPLAHAQAPAETAAAAASAPVAPVALPDRAAFDAWRSGDPTRAEAYEGFVDVMSRLGVRDVLEPWTLWRQGTDWETARMPAFAVPPREQWAAIAPTLRLLRDEVVPVVGRVVVASGYRTSAYNAAAKGASKSDHLRFGALDLLPTREWRREDLHAALLRIHAEHGPQAKMGLGLYSGLRFHVDTRRFRRW